MKKLFMLAAAAVLAFGVSVVAPQAVSAGGSDGSVPYTVTATGVTLSGGAKFEAHGHVNWKTTAGNFGVHFDPNNGHPGGKWIGKATFKFTPPLAPGECLTWVQVHGFNEHFGEGGQEPICVPTEEPPVEEPPVEEPPTEEPDATVTVLPVPVVTQGFYTCNGDTRVFTPGAATFPAAPSGTVWDAPAGDGVVLPDPTNGAGFGPTGVMLSTTGEYLFDPAVQGEQGAWLVTETHAYFSFSFTAVAVPSEPCATEEEPPVEEPVAPDAEAVVYQLHSCDLPGTITVPDVEGVAYMLSTVESGDASIRIWPGSYTATEDRFDGDSPRFYGTVTVTALWIAHPTVELGSWTQVFGEAEDCVTEEPPVEEPPVEEEPSDELAHTGDETLPLILTALGFIGAGVMLRISRRRLV